MDKVLAGSANTMIDARGIKAVGDLCEFRNGRGFSGTEWSDEGWPIIRIQNLNGSREFNYFNGPRRSHGL